MNGAPALVLIAEDEPLASMALRAQIEALGHTVAAVARNGDEAAALARCLPADLAIFDMNMPGPSGLEAATRIFPHAPVPVLLLTGFGTADLPDPIPRPPIFGILTKPVGLAELRAGIDAALAAFAAWVREGDHEAEVRRARDERDLIARALEADRGISADAAAALLDQARDQGADPGRYARDLLDAAD